MPSTLSAVLHRQATALLGRERERELLLGLTGDDGPVVAWVHGIAGSGKTALLRAFAADVRERDATVLTLDCRTVEPTPAGFLAALSPVLEASIGSASEAGEALSRRGDRVVVALDAFEVLGLLDSWVRLTLLPALPATTRLVITSREAPMAAWRADLGPLLRTVTLGPLPPAAAEALLRRSGVAAERAPRVNRYAHGHPLSLMLAASALAERPDLPLADMPAPTAVEALARVYLDGLDDATRRALDAASVTRRTTQSLLAAMLPGEPAHEAFDRLRALDFTELGGEGLVVHETVREAVAALLRVRDPLAHRRLKAAAWHQLRREIRDAPPSDLWRYTADMLYLIENPMVREIYFPTSAPLHAHEPAREGDWTGIEAIARLHEPEEMVAIVRRWWDAAPETFVVARDPAGIVTGFYFLFVPRNVSPRLLEADPVTRAWREHLRRRPLPHGQIALFIRQWGTLAGGDSPMPGEPSICLDIKRTYLELRPALGRVYLPVRDLGDSLDRLSPLGFGPAPGHDAEIGGVTYHMLFSEFGPGSVDGWLAELGARELHLGEQQPLAGGDQRRLTLDGRAIDLTRLEHGVLRHLHAHDGRAVPRAELFREVWGHDWVGDGNALEAVVSSLRRKLGPRATALETVRGVGYRLHALA